MAIDPTAIGPAGDSSPISSFGVYEIRALLGAGGMGQVYRAFDSRLGREIALKVIRRSAVDDESALDRLLREATLASALNHPNIVTIYETGVVGADRYIAMELIEGATPAPLAAQGLPLSRIVGIARQVAEALAVAHAQQIVHRDIKPDNVMVRPDGYVKLLDFGSRARNRIATGAERPAGTASTEAGLILGTIGYMAPEQARGETVTAEADVFSLGVLLCELVTGRHPFMAASQLGTLNALLWETPEPPSLLNPELPRARPADSRVAAEGSAAQARRERSDVSPRAGARFQHRVVVGHGRAPAAGGEHERRRARRRARGDQPRVRTRAQRQGAHPRRLRRGGRWQDHACRRVRQRA